MTATVSVRVDLGPRSYDVIVGTHLLKGAGSRIAPLLRDKRVVIVSDETVAGLYLDTLVAGLDTAGITHDRIVLPVGEGTKDFVHLERLVGAILDMRPERGTALVALGGGVIGDITGFAASIVLRGIDFVQIPTTLLSLVDSSVGGKTGINTVHGKNLIGSFYQPRLVLADIATLETLSRRELLAGYAEVAKYGLIGDASFFAWLEANGTAIRDGDEAARHKAVVKSCTAKAAIVAADEREAGPRGLLNLGHTFAHALEADTGFGPDLLHGEAVAIGMVLAFDLSVHLGLCPADDAARIRRHFETIGLPSGLEAVAGQGWDAGRLLSLMQHDKKVRQGKLTFVLARGIGQAFLAHDVDANQVERLLEGAITA